MYCIKCGTKLSENANFCANCGQKVDRSELPDDEIVEVSETKTEIDANESVEVDCEYDPYEEVEENEPESIDTITLPKTAADQVKEKAIALLSAVWAETKKLSKFLYHKAKGALCAFWAMLSTFGKVMTISIAVCVILCLVAFICKKPGSLVCGIIQIVLFDAQWQYS